MGDALAVWLRLADERRQVRPKRLGALAIEAKVDLACIDQVGALASAEPIPLVAVECEACDRQRLALGASDFDPVIRSAARIVAVPHLRDYALKSRLAGVLEHLAAVDVEALAELNVRPVDELLEQRFALDQRQLSKIVAVQVKQ